MWNNNIESEPQMKKLLTKICIGTVAFAVFLVVGYPKTTPTTNNTQQNVKKKSMINRNQSGHFTRGGNTVKSTTNNKSKSQYGVIYMGEPTAGLLD